MRYDNYENKIEKVERLLKLAFKHLTKILISAGVIFATVIALLATRGIIVNATSCPLEITYGDNLEYKANAFMSNVGYEFCPVGGDEWSTELPSTPGTYMVRAVAKATFGKRYGDYEIFTIKPKSVEVLIDSASLVYGEEPKVTASLANEDVIVCTGFVYNSDRTTVAASLDGIKVFNQEGVDVTESYAFTAPERQLVTKPRPITVETFGAEKIYDGLPLQNENYVISSGSLAYGDSLNVSFTSSITDAGVIENDFEYTVTSAEGVDVTEFYNLTKEKGNLTVTKRSIPIYTTFRSRSRR